MNPTALGVRIPGSVSFDILLLTMGLIVASLSKVERGLKLALASSILTEIRYHNLVVIRSVGMNRGKFRKEDRTSSLCEFQVKGLHHESDRERGVLYKYIIYSLFVCVGENYYWRAADPDNMPTPEEVRKVLYEEGEKQRRKVLGDAHVDKCG